MLKRLDAKLQHMRSGTDRRQDFILADAKDADMAFGLAAPGRDPVSGRPRGIRGYREQIRAIVAQDVVDIMLLSASSLEQLAMDEQLFAGSPVTSAVRANDTTDIWLVRGGVYPHRPSKPFRSASLRHAIRAADLGLYSITFCNDIECDHASLTAFAAFREEAEQLCFRYFLEVFAPPASAGLGPEQVSGFLNDHIVRALAGVTRTQQPLFLKIPYFGPAALEELVAYDPGLIVGILGGSAGTTRDAFQLLHDAQRHGARVALFGRKINHAEDPLAFIAWLRRIADGDVAPDEAVRGYHADLARSGLPSRRSLEEDLLLTPEAGPCR